MATLPNRSATTGLHRGFQPRTLPRAGGDRDWLRADSSAGHLSAACIPNYELGRGKWPKILFHRVRTDAIGGPRCAPTLLREKESQSVRIVSNQTGGRFDGHQDEAGGGAFFLRLGGGGGGDVTRLPFPETNRKRLAG